MTTGGARPWSTTSNPLPLQVHLILFPSTLSLKSPEYNNVNLPPTLTASITNPSEHSITILRWSTPLDPLAPSLGILKLAAVSPTSDDRREIEIPGISIRRVVPPPEDEYVVIPPHSKTSAVVNDGVAAGQYTGAPVGATAVFEGIHSGRGSFGRVLDMIREDAARTLQRGQTANYELWMEGAWGGLWGGVFRGGEGWEAGVGGGDVSEEAVEREEESRRFRSNTVVLEVVE